MLDVCAAEGIAVVPYGGGTSVVGGVAPLRGSHERLISLDLARLREVEVDERSLTARLGAGLRGPEAEAALGERGFTLGHFPQSFEYATIGGFAATRSAGQASSGYGRFDALVSSIRLIAPAGEMRTLETPHTAAGPALRELIVGSEGVLGVIPEATVRIRPKPRVRRYEAWIAESFEAGAEIVRAMAQGPGLPDVVRISDEEETRVSLALSGPKGLAGTLFGGYLGLRGKRDGCLIVIGLEGDEESVARRRALAVRALRAGGAAYLGQGAGKSWEHGRYEGPYLRDALMDAGALVETLETSHTWARLGELHAAVGTAIRDALAAQGTPGIVMCHLSHAYADGASLYFTFIARARRGEEIEQWRRREARRLRGDRRHRRHDHPPPRGRPRPRPLHGGRGGGDGAGGPAGRQGATRPGRDHEPGKADSFAVTREAPEQIRDLLVFRDGPLRPPMFERRGRR